MIICSLYKPVLVSIQTVIEMNKEIILKKLKKHTIKNIRLCHNDIDFDILTKIKQSNVESVIIYQSAANSYQCLDCVHNESKQVLNIHQSCRSYIEKIAEIISDNDKMHSLKLDLYCLKNSFDLITNSLKSNRTLTKISLTFTDLSSNCMKGFADAVANNKSLTNFDFGNSNLDECAANEIAKILISNNIQKLNITGNKMCNRSIPKNVLSVIIKALKNNCSLSKLVLDSNYDLNYLIDDFTQYLSNSCSLRKLSIKNCGLSCNSMFEISVSLKNNICLKHINITNNILRFDVKHNQTEYWLHCNSMLKSITANYLRTDKYGQIGIGNLLSDSNTKLKKVVIGGINRSETYEIKKIFCALRTNTSLIKLHVSDYIFTNDLTAILCESLQHNCTLQHLTLINNNLNYEHCLSIANLLSSNCNLHSLNIQNIQNIRDIRLANDNNESFALIADSLKTNSVLKKLSFSNFHQISASTTTVISIASMLSSNKSLTRLNMHGFIIEHDAIDYLSEALRLNKSLISLRITLNQNSSNSTLSIVNAISSSCIQKLIIYEYGDEIETSFNNDEMKQLKQLLQSNFTLTDFYSDKIDFCDDCDFVDNIMKRNKQIVKTRRFNVVKKLAY